MDEQLCMACEGKPAPENNPCAVCGARANRPADDGLVAWSLAIAGIERDTLLHDLTDEEIAGIVTALRAQSDAEVEREVLREALRVFVGCALPVAAEINPRGHNWCEPYLDQALTIAIEALERGEHRKDGV